MICRPCYDVALDEGATPASKPAHSISHAYRTENPAASMMRGFLVFVVYLAGLAIGMPGGVLPGSGAGAGADVFSFSATTPDQYARLAALLSAIAFGAGYDPTMFGSVWSLMPAALKKRKVSEH